MQPARFQFNLNTRPCEKNHKAAKPGSAAALLDMKLCTCDETELSDTTCSVLTQQRGEPVDRVLSMPRAAHAMPNMLAREKEM